MGDALDELGVAGGEASVAFFAGVGFLKKAMLLGGGEGALDDEAEVAVHLRQAVAQGDAVIAVEDGELGGFDGLDAKSGRLLPVEALIVCDPPVFDGELSDLFYAVLTDKIHAKTALEDEIVGGTGLLFAEEEFLFFDLFVAHIARQHGGLFFVE